MTDAGACLPDDSVRLAAASPLWDEVISKARCADSALDPDSWFPIGTDIEIARRQAADAIAICAGCPVRVKCLALSLRHWPIGQHGVWGGLVPAERAALRQGLARPHVPSSALPIPHRAEQVQATESHAALGAEVRG